MRKYNILNSVKYVVDNSKNVFFHEDKIDNVLSLLKPVEEKSWLDDFIDTDNYNDEEKIRFLLLVESLNFCYWGTNPKWKIEHEGKLFSGYYGLIYALQRAILSGINILDFNELKNIKFEEFDELLRGTAKISMAEERYDILKQLIVETNKIPNLLNYFLQANDAEELLGLIVAAFSNFRDQSIYKNEEVFFFKRATLLVRDLYLSIPKIKEKIKNIDSLTACADYKIPQVLRHYGILDYNKSLANKVDSNIEITHDSEEEIEIRANMIWAVEIIRRKLLDKRIDSLAIYIDTSLWLLSKNKDLKFKPYHLSRTLYY